MRYQAIIFDMGDIFFDATIWRKSLVSWINKLGVDIDYPEFCAQWEARLAAVYVGRCEYWDAFTNFMADLGLDHVGTEQTIAFARTKAAEIEERVLFDGVAETLARLKGAGLKLAVLSDTESHEQRVRQRLADLHIEEYFDAVVTSMDIGHVKPQPQAYQAALDRLGVTKNQSAFVAHDQDELTGAMDFGLTTIAYNYSDGVTAELYIEQFSELLVVIGLDDDSVDSIY